jgi:hypothetical protein
LIASLSGLTAQTESYEAFGNQIGSGTDTYSVNTLGERVRKVDGEANNDGHIALWRKSDPVSSDKLLLGCSSSAR